MLTSDTPFTVYGKRVATVTIPADKTNRRVPLTDQVGNMSMILTGEQLSFIVMTNTAEGLKAMYNAGYLEQLSYGPTKLKPFAFDKGKVVIIYEKGLYGRLLSLGEDPFESEAYRLLKDTCNPTRLPHCFMHGITPVSFYIPLYQPPKLSSGASNFWSIRLEYIS